MIALELLTGKKLIQGTTQKMLIRKIISLKFCLYLVEQGTDLNFNSNKMFSRLKAIHNVRFRASSIKTTEIKRNKPDETRERKIAHIKLLI